MQKVEFLSEYQAFTRQILQEVRQWTNGKKELRNRDIQESLRDLKLDEVSPNRVEEDL